MIYVRRGVFETNSSSTHSIVIAREDTNLNYDRVDFRIDEYGWESASYWDVGSKASYFYTCACECLERDVADDIVALLAPYGINCTFSRPPVFEKFNGCQYLDNGYVDHADEARDFVDSLLSDAALLIDFLFNDKSNIATGNDNGDDSRMYPTYPDCEYVEYYKGN